MRAGVGHSVNPTSTEAAIEATRAALAQAGTETCDLALMFSTSKHDPTELRDGLRSVAGPATRIAGGNAMGVVTRDYLGYDGFEVGVAVLSAGPGDDIDLFMEEYQNRLVMAVDEERGGLMMFENDLKAGAEIQLMRRSIDFGYMEEKVNQLYERIGDREPVLALYVDCGGRISMFTGTEEEEAAEIQRTVGSRTPLLGMYSAIEIAKVGGEVQPLDWTGVLCILSQ
jgi:hypothetical protein